MIRKIIMSLFVLAALSEGAEAQTFGISTDLLGYAELGTLNMDASYALNRRWSLTAGLRYNPFTYEKGDDGEQFQYRQRSCSIGARIWPWHTWSGWWFAGKLRYQEYNHGGLVSPETEEGDRIGTGLYSGYTHMLAPHLNLEFGLGLWTGVSSYKVYSCPSCGVTLEEGSKYFLLPDDVMISIVYVF